MRASSSPAARRKPSHGAFAAMPEVDRVLGNEEKLDARLWADDRRVRRRRYHGGAHDNAASVERSQGHTRAFVQVQNGCDHRCTFCIIPFGRGNSRSLPMAEVVAQVRALAERGYREVVLTGVDITSYERRGRAFGRAGEAHLEGRA